ncbi:DUF5808 domain-containing protein [Flavobacterium terrigena]|uniref:DUF5808 domain-containing protein n=1 Tax=Flavobacterium terrigena TaxID=402734 RepID=UPI000A64E6ED|nr:DUF5808 domain-containing protein [Flavobacterium terrigena]
MKNPSKEQIEAWRKDSNNWKFGVFYYNPEDESLLPPKREAWMGFTVNFANWKSIGLLILSLGFFSFVISMILHKN